MPGLERGANLARREAQQIVKRPWKHVEVWHGGAVVFQYLPLSLLSRKYTKVTMFSSYSGPVFHLHHLHLV